MKSEPRALPPDLSLAERERRWAAAQEHSWRLDKIVLEPAR